MNKLRRDIRIAMLGAAAGLFSISLFLMIARIDAYYIYLNELDRGPYHSGVKELWWIPVAFWHLLLSISASLMAHRYLTSTRASSPFYLWQAIGAFVLLGWTLSLFTIVALEALMSGELNSSSLLYRIDVPSVFKFAASICAAHVMYGSAMHASSREYLEIRPYNLLEDSTVFMPHRSFQKPLKQFSLMKRTKT